MHQSGVFVRRVSIPFVPIAAGMMFFIGFEWGGFQLALLRVAQEFSLTESVMGLLAGLQFLAMAGLPLLVGRMADRVGKKRILIMTLPVFMLGCALAVLSRSPLIFVLAVLLIGSAFSVTETVSAAVVSDIKGGASARTMNIVQSLFSLGAVAGPLVSEFFMLRGASWRVVFLTAGLGYLLLYPLLLLSRVPAVKTQEEKKGNMLRVFKTPMLAFMGVAMFLYVGIESGIAFFIDSFFHLEFSAASIGAYGIAVFWLCTALSRIAFGQIRFQPQRVVLVGFACITALIVMMFFAAGEAGMLILCAAAGIACGPLWPIIASLGMGACPEDTGTAMGVISTTGSLGGAALPALIGVLTELFGIRPAFLVLSIVTLATTGMMLFVQRSFKRKAQPPCAPEQGG